MHEKSLDPTTVLSILRTAGMDIGPSQTRSQSDNIAQFAAHIRGGAKRHDPVRSVLSRVGDRWSCLFLMLLRHGRLRPGALLRLVNLMHDPAEAPLTQRIMTMRLRDLLRDGLLTRTVIAGNIVGVEYALSDFGQQVVERIAALNYFLLDHASQIEQARKAYDLIES